MLCNYFQLKEMNFGQLMEIYAEGNIEKARDEFSNEDLNLGILYVEQDFYQYLKNVFFAADGARYCVWEEKGRYLSALRLEPYKDGLLLEALETHPQYRRKEYAKQLIRSVLQLLEGTGVHAIYAHVHKKNTASLQTHMSCGFRRVSKQATYIDGSVNSACCTLCYFF